MNFLISNIEYTCKYLHLQMLELEEVEKYIAEIEKEKEEEAEKKKQKK